MCINACLLCMHTHADQVGGEAYWRWIKIKDAGILYENIHEIIRVSRPAHVVQKVDYYFRSRKDEIDLEIFDMLISFTDFLSFKEMFISYRKVYMYACIELSIGHYIVGCLTNCK